MGATEAVGLSDGVILRQGSWISNTVGMRDVVCYIYRMSTRLGFCLVTFALLTSSVLCAAGAGLEASDDIDEAIRSAMLT